MKPIIFLATFLLALNACTDAPKPASVNAVATETKSTLSFKEFTKKFKVVQLPFYYLGWARNEFYRNQSFELKNNTTDTLYYKKEYDATVYGYGMLADTATFYALIYFEQADEIFPVLVTYSKSGQLIHREPLIVHGCGSDCGLKYCSYTAQIDRSHNIYLADTLKYEGFCDSTGKYTSGDSTFIFSKIGQVNKNGRIVLHAEKEQREKGSK